MHKKTIHIVLILKPGESKRPERLVCVDVWCKRTMATVNREIDVKLENNQGIHWSDVPEDVTVIEHKCRGCPRMYHIYTPQTARAKAETMDIINEQSVV